MRMDLTDRVERGASLLVVDDNELNRDALSCLLRLHQYEVEAAGSGPEALSLINTRKYDLVVLDIEMPGMNGLQVLTDIRTTRNQTDLPVIMLSGSSEQHDRAQASRLGATGYLLKYPTPEQVKAVIAPFCARRQPRPA